MLTEESEESKESKESKETVLEKILKVMERIEKKLEAPPFKLMEELRQIRNQIGTTKLHA